MTNWALLYQRYYKLGIWRCLRYLKKTGSREPGPDAEDVVQEVFEHLFRRGLRPGDRFKGLFYKTLFDRLINFVWRNQRPIEITFVQKGLEPTERKTRHGKMAKFKRKSRITDSFPTQIFGVQLSEIELRDYVRKK